MLISAATVVMSALFFSTSTALSVLVGTVIAMINLSFMAKSIKSAFLLKADKAKSFIVKRYYLRFIVTVVVIGLLVAGKLVNPVGFITGFSVIMMTTLAITLFFVRKESF